MGYTMMTGYAAGDPAHRNRTTRSMPHRRHLFSAAIFLLILVALPLTARAQLFETRAAQAFLMDGDTGTVLFAKEADTPVPPASLAKLMTVELVFQALEAGRLRLDDRFQISENAWRTGGAVSGTSTMFAEVNSSVPLADLIRGIIIQSGNDAAIAIAESMAGSEDAFARLMTQRARDLGLRRSVFANATGLPHPDAGVTMRELALLAQHIERTYPAFYDIFSEVDFSWNDINQRNRNPLLRFDIGADGLKTGFTQASGYAIVGSVERDGQRLFLAMSGMQSAEERAEEARRMLEWGLHAFARRQLFTRNEIVGEARVYGGARPAVPLTAGNPVDILVPVSDAERLRADIVYSWPLNAPVEEGDRVAMLQLWDGETLSRTVPLYAAEAVATGPLHRRALHALRELLLFWL